MANASRHVVCWLIVATLGAAELAPARAEIISAHPVPNRTAAPRALVIARLEAAGVSRDLAVARVAVLSEEELMTLAHQFDEAPAAGFFAEILTILLVTHVVIGLVVYFVVRNRQKKGSDPFI